MRIEHRIRVALTAALFTLGLAAGVGLGPSTAGAEAPQQGILPGYKCPRPPKGGCVSPKDCLHKHEQSCAHFIQCNDARIAYVMPCPAGLEWNNREKICDWPRNARCTVTPPKEGQ